MKILQIILIFLLVNTVICQKAQNLEFSLYSDTIEANHINKKIGELLYNFVKNRVDFVQFNDANNCDIRAHLICFVLEKKFDNLKVGKAWLFADSKRASKKNIYNENNYSNLSLKTGSVNWGYHVAPVIIMENDTMVIDPTTQKSITAVRKWANDLIPIDSKGYLIIKKTQFFCYPTDEDNKFIETDMTWDIPDTESDLYDAYTDLAIKIAIAYTGFSDPSQIVYYKNRIMELCNK